MRQLLPTPLDSVDPIDLYPHDARPAPDGRPWVMANMIASIDGATAVGGLSGGLGGPADKDVFHAIRASADYILVASATAVAERYRTPTTDPETADRRRAAGLTPVPGLAIATRSGRIDPTLPAFVDRTNAQPRPLVITGTDADDDALGQLDAEVVRVGAGVPTPHHILQVLHERGARVVLAEGGPRFNGQLHGAGVIDEFCLSISPLIVGGDSVRAVSHGPDGHTADMRLDRLLEQDGLLFARYVRR